MMCYAYFPPFIRPSFAFSKCSSTPPAPGSCEDHLLIAKGDWTMPSTKTLAAT
jgi:hypothetical protein